MSLNYGDELSPNILDAWTVSRVLSLLQNKDFGPEYFATQNQIAN